MKANSLSVLLLGLGFCLVGAFVSCSSDEPEFRQPTSPEINLTRSEQLVNDNINDFGLKLFNAISSDPTIVSRNPNFAVSPVSIAIALAMCANVCDDDLKAEVLYALDCENIEELNVLCRKLMMYLPDPSNKCDISLCNALWHDNGVSPTASCRSAITDYFFGQISSIDFSDLKTAGDIINDWIARSTYNIITDVFDPINLLGTKAILANALYFKGGWTDPFDMSKTVVRTFHGIKGDRDVELMCDKRTMQYVASEHFQAVRLSYKGPYEMIAVLPDADTNIDDFCKAFDSSDLTQCTDETAIYLVSLSIPKFESFLQESIGDVLSEFGINLSESRFTEIVGGDDKKGLGLSHIAKVSTDEDGTVAAAVTIVGESIMPPPQHVEREVTLTFDRPFLYLIRNNVTGSIIMAGRFAK